VLGTPHENNWPEALKLSDMKGTFPKFRPVALGEYTKGLTEIELDLLKGLIALDPYKRISAKMALMHPYFDNITNHDESI